MKKKREAESNVVPKLDEQDIELLADYIEGQVFFDIKERIQKAIAEWVSMVEFIEKLDRKDNQNK
jgi:hypothetical protein